MSGCCRQEPSFCRVCRLEPTSTTSVVDVSRRRQSLSALDVVEIKVILSGVVSSGVVCRRNRDCLGVVSSSCRLEPNGTTTTSSLLALDVVEIKSCS